jgi:hypothetical protein
MRLDIIGDFMIKPIIFLHMSSIGKHDIVLQEFEDLLTKYNIRDKAKVIVNYNDTPDEYEFPSILKLHNIAKGLEEDTPIMYLYPKGIHMTPGEEWKCRWRRYIFDFMLSSLDTLCELVQKYPVLGPFYGSHYMGDHYSGNSWISKSSYISKLPSILDMSPDDFPVQGDYVLKYNNLSRYMCEKWILSLKKLDKSNFYQYANLMYGIPEQLFK